MTDTPITRFFSWWNQAYREHDFTPAGFARFFTADAPFIVDGAVRGTGPEAICAHFQRIRAKTDAVTLETPVRATLADDRLAFARYATTFEGAEGAGTEECLAVATISDGRLASFEVISRQR